MRQLALFATGFACLIGVGFLARGQAGNPHEQGTPLFDAYTPRQYSGHAQNWAIAQGLSGFIYVANTGGLLEFDGARWRSIPLGDNSLVRALAVDAYGQIFVGGQGLFGVIRPDSAGFHTYQSLLHLLPPDVQEKFGNVWHLFADGTDIYLNTGYHLVRLRGDQAETWATVSGQDAFHTAFLVEGVLYVRQYGVGLQRLLKDRLTLVPGGDRFAQPTERVDAIMPYNTDGAVLIMTRTQGSFVLQNNLLTPFRTQADALLEPYNLYHGAALGQGLFGLATARGGFIVINRQGQLVHHIGRTDGLPADIVRFVFQDREGSTWLALDGGIAHLEYPSPLTRFGERRGIEGSLTGVVRFNGELYLSGGVGLQRLQELGEGISRFLAFPGFTEQVWDLLPHGDELLVATTHGLFSVNRKGKLSGVLHTSDRVRPGEDQIYYCLTPDPQNPTRIYAGKDRTGIALLERTGNTWREVATFPGPEAAWGRVRFIVPDPTDPNTLWYGDELNGLYLVKFTPNGAIYNGFGPDQGLPYLQGNSVFFVDEKIFVATNSGVFRFNGETGRFEPEPLFGPTFTSGNAAAEFLAPAGEGYAWLNYALAGDRQSAFRLDILQQVTSDRYRVLPSPVKRLRNVLVRDIWVDEDGTSWLATELDGLLRYNPALTKNVEAGFANMVVSVLANDSTELYGGLFVPTDTSNVPTAPLAIHFSQNALRFEFAALTFDANSAVQYRSLLEGFDPQWSQWTNEDARSYTNLPPGSYTFRVQARNVYGQTGIEGLYRFTLLPPWYLTWWAVTLFALAGVGVVIGGALGYNRYRTAQLEARNRILEATVQERTAEVVKQKEEIEEKNRNITEKNAELENAYEEIRAQNENLEAAYHIIEEKNKDITDSIHYASRIQQAFLPTKDEIRKVFPNSFVMLMPRDIVSGDYYWFGRRGDYVLLAGADCTGHGVPGAFMSMMGNTLLHQIVSEGIVHPGEVLDILDQKVKFNLKQFDPNSRTNDGMEVMLWTVNTKTRELMYASASRPMVHIRGGVLTEIKAEKIPIGGAQYRDHRGFEAHAFPYETGDWVYTFSDGFPDQFGGDQGRKYMLKRAKEKLLEIHHLPADEQEAILRVEMEEWMRSGGYEQTDDILIIGFQLP